MKRTSLFSYGYRYDFRSYKPYAGAVSKLGKLAKGVKTVKKQELFYSLLLKQR
jgi:hypothetical protein